MPLSAIRLRLLVISLLTVSFIGALDNTVVSTSLATIAGTLGALQSMGWVIVGYTLASTVTLPVIGKLADLLGPRRVFLASLLIFIAASLACGFASSMLWLVAARVVQGMSSAGLQLMSQTIIARVASPRQRPKLLSIVGAAFPIAILIGPVLGGLITDYWGWPWVFWINLPVGVVAFALALFAVPHLEPGTRAPFDFAGTIALTAALVSIVLAVTWIGDKTQTVQTILAFAAAAVATVLFFVIENRVVEPIVPLRFFASRTVAAGTVLSAIVGISVFSLTSYLPTYFQMAYQLSATESGLVPIATVFGMLVSNLVTGFLASRTGQYRVFPVIGTSLGTAGLLAMAALPAGLPLWVPMTAMAVVGIGTGSFMSLIVAVVQSAVPPSETGSITATVNLARQVGSTVATAVIGGVIGFGVAALLPPGLSAETLTPQLVRAASSAVQLQVGAIYSTVFVPIFVATALVFAVGIVASILLPSGRLSDERIAETESLTV